jgi:hypothetical protein
VGPSGGMVDAGDSKSPALTGVPVRVRPWVPTFFFTITVVNVLLRLQCKLRCSVVLFASLHFCLLKDVEEKLGRSSIF